MVENIDPVIISMWKLIDNLKQNREKEPSNIDKRLHKTKYHLSRKVNEDPGLSCSSPSSPHLEHCVGPLALGPGFILRVWTGFLDAILFGGMPLST